VRRASFRDPALAALGAFAFANTLLWGRVAQREGVGLPAMLSVRFLLTGVLMLAVLVLLGRPVLPARGERGLVLGLGVVAYGVESIFFFMALERSSTAVVVVLFYTHVVIVAIGEVVLGAMRATAQLAVAVALALAGASVVALSGGGEIRIQAVGVLCVLGSIACYTGYVLASGRLVRRTEPLTAAAWVAFGAAAGAGSWGVGRGDFGALPSSALGPILAMAVATATAFTLWFVVVGRLGSARTAIIMMLEAPFGIVLTAVVLDDPWSWAVAAGGALVLGGAVLAALETPIATEAIEAATGP
jgi:drug/metabolite transporter (DMT)-like permease